MIRYTCFLFLQILLLYGCVKVENDVEVRFKKKPVVNCLFYPDSIWKVNVTLSPSSSSELPEPIYNALVKLFEDGNFVEELKHERDGNYISLLNKKPVTGKTYSISVQVAGYPLLTAKDTIPSAISVTDIKTDTVPFKFSFSPFFDPATVFSSKVSFTDTDLKPKCYLIRPLYYLREELSIYSVTNKTFDSLRVKRLLSQTDSFKLSKLAGQVFIGLSEFKRNLDSVFYPSAVLPAIYQYSYEGASAVFKEANFKQHQAYITDVQFKQIGDYYYLLFGEKLSETPIQNKQLNTLINYYPGGTYSIVNGEIVKKEAHYFLDIITISKAGYNYFSTYVQNVTNRGNPFTEPVNTFSNIQNGYGIFAGMHIKREMVW